MPTASLCGSAIEAVPQLVGQDPVRTILQVAVCNQIFVELFHCQQLFHLPTWNWLIEIYIFTDESLEVFVYRETMDPQPTVFTVL